TKSLASPNGSASIKVATSTLVRGAPSVPLIVTGLAVSGASAIVTLPVIVIVAVPGGSSLTVRLTGKTPSSLNWWPPCTAKLPLPSATTVPALGAEPSPQLIVAVKSVGTFVGKPGSLNVAICVVGGSTCPSTVPAGNVSTPLVKLSASVTVAVLLVEMSKV